jgi:hypothetical protein
MNTIELYICLIDLLFIIHLTWSYVYYGNVATLLLLIAKHDIHLKATCSKPVSILFEPHEPHVTLIEYDMCSPLLFSHTSGWATDWDWNEMYLHLLYISLFGKSRMGNKSRLEWGLPWWILGLMSTTQRACAWSHHQRVIFLFPLHLCKDYVLIFVM